MKNKIFLGGTTENTTWRDDVIKFLETFDDVQYFNPVVENWTDEDQKIEKYEKDEMCNIHLYVITSAMNGVFSIAEVVQSSNEDAKITFFHIIEKGFDESKLKSLEATCSLVKDNGGTVSKDFTGIDSLIHNLSQYLTVGENI